MKAYASSTAYYIQVPAYGTKITSITMTVSSTGAAIDGGNNSATLFFSSSNSTSAAGVGVASGTGASSVTIDCSSLDLNTGYITANGGVRVWDVTVTYSTDAITQVSTPAFSLAEGTYLGTKSVSLSCSTADASIYYTEDGSTPSSSSTLYSSAISVSSNKTIKAIAIRAGLDNSEVASAEYSIIPSIPARTPKNYNSNYYVKVTDVNELENGDAILIVNQDGDYVMAGQGSNIRNCDGLTSSEGVISTVPANAQKIIIIKVNNRFFFSTGDNSYLYANSSSSNYIGTNTETIAGQNAMASIEVAGSGDATILFLGTNTRNSLRYNNNNNGNPRFTCYASGQEAVQIYKEVPAIRISDACTDGDYFYGTYSSSYAFIVPSDLAISEIKVVGSSLQFTGYSTGSTVPANTGVIVSAIEDGVYPITLSNEAGTSVLGAENMLKASSVAMTGDNLFYRLTMHNGSEIGFWWGAASGAAFDIAANKAYLAVPVSAAREGFAFGEETNGITANNREAIANIRYYNLQGVEVAQPSRGLYIVNGKKVIIK